jgi:hypothetical protein
MQVGGGIAGDALPSGLGPFVTLHLPPEGNHCDHSWHAPTVVGMTADFKPRGQPRPLSKQHCTPRHSQKTPRSNTRTLAPLPALPRSPVSLPPRPLARPPPERAVSYCKYPPAGQRSVAYPVRAVYRKGVGVPALARYLEDANDETEVSERLRPARVSGAPVVGGAAAVTEMAGGGGLRLGGVLPAHAWRGIRGKWEWTPTWVRGGRGDPPARLWCRRRWMNSGAAGKQRACCIERQLCRARVFSRLVHPTL